MSSMPGLGPIPPVWPTGTRNTPRVAPRVLAGLVTVLAAIGVHLMWVFFVNSAAGQRIDRAAFEGAAFEQGRLWQVAQPVLNVVSYALVIGGAAAAVLIAIFRKRVLLALELLALIGGANLTTQLIKDWYPRPHLLPGWTGPNSLPSGHTTVAASVSAALLLAVPRRWRPVVALLGAGWTIAIGLSTLVGQWHRPADVIAAVLVVLAWGALICALTSFHTMDQAEDELRGNLVWKRRWPYRLTPTVSTTSWVVGTTMTALAAIGLTVWIVVIWRLLLASPDVSDYFVTAYGGGAAGVVGFTLASFAVLLVVRQATGAPRSVEI